MPGVGDQAEAARAKLKLPRMQTVGQVSDCNFYAPHSPAATLAQEARCCCSNAKQALQSVAGARRRRMALRRVSWLSAVALTCAWAQPAWLGADHEQGALAALRSSTGHGTATHGFMSEAQLAGLRAAAESGHAMKLYQLSLLYLYGHEGGVSVSLAPSTAALLMRRAAEAGYAPAQTALGSMLLDGVGVRQDRRAGQRWLETAAEGGERSGDPNAMWLRGTEALRAGDSADGERWLRHALGARPGHDGALFALGLLYEYGRAAGGLSKEAQAEEAVSLYRQAAAVGHMDASYHLALCLLYGRGVQQSMPEAAVLLQRAAGRGHGAAAFWLGTVLMQGRGGVEVDYDRSSALFEQAAVSGDKRVAEQARRAADDLKDLLAKARSRRQEVLGWVRAGGVGRVTRTQEEAEEAMGLRRMPAADGQADTSAVGELEWHLGASEAEELSHRREASAHKRRRLGDALARARAAERGRLGIPAQPHGRNRADELFPPSVEGA